jgi:lipoprotein-releasing system permease protein
MLNNIENSPAVSAKLEKFLGFPLYGLSVFDTHSAIFNWIDLQREPIPLVLGLIGLVAVFNIISTLLIMVLDKTNSIGILRTVGLKSKQIRYIFIRHGILLAIKGLIIGCGLTLIVSILQKYTGFITMDPDVYYLDTVPVDIQLWHYALVISLTLIFSGLASAVPAWAASHISPIKAIRYK